MFSLGHNMRKLRTDHNISVVEMAEIAGVTKSYISKLERGEQQNPSVFVIQRIAQHFGTTVEEILNADVNDSDASEEAWNLLLDELMGSGISIMEFKEFVEFKQWQKKKK